MSSIHPLPSAVDAWALAQTAEGLQLPGEGPQFSPLVQQMVQMTERMFGGPVEATLVSDPDAGGGPWVEFACTVRGSYAEHRQRKSQWYDEVSRMVPGASTEFRLCLTAIDDG